MAKIHCAHILVQHRFEAEDILKKLQSGSTFEDLAKKFSKCSSAENGGDLGVLDVRKLDSDFLEAAELLKTNQVSTIVRTKFGYHLIKRIS